ncbi:transcription factor with AP2 domain(s), putative (ApiAP2) [Plasmodium ovale wallikeri]|uniref:Transcription factor with AP2 domain(S), putative (ApiAP2) n=1 Tax=Plasmodium ovale wallikeri TaxID=864142 RepID=A0A1A8Z8F3_PLAOA|nr:transcription factor with AP2 domain(s), putative (ApiAP2) [Plasmodium ovale wallikeri]SBT40146.1 transcription factor with AP2 domain(s), putative (ApiAP2) [Plasmodium ovale wallikeri]
MSCAVDVDKYCEEKISSHICYHPHLSASLHARPGKFYPILSPRFCPPRFCPPRFFPPRFFPPRFCPPRFLPPRFFSPRFFPFFLFPHISTV